jgi:hypothetical protein
MSTMTKISQLARHTGDPQILQTGPSSLPGIDRCAKFLGWFSLWLGLAEVLAPQRMARCLGMNGKAKLLRVFGLREIGAGILTLSNERHVGMWSRVAGDGFDIATLLAAQTRHNPKRGNVSLALALVLGITALDFIVAQGLAARHGRSRGEHRLYQDRSGFPQGLAAARGAARKPALQPHSSAFS